MWYLWQQDHPISARNYTSDTGASVLDLQAKLRLFNIRAGSDRTYTAAQMLNTQAGYPLCYVYSESVAAVAGSGVSRRGVNAAGKRSWAIKQSKLNCPISKVFVA